MAAIDGPAGPPMATKSAMDGPAGPVVAGDRTCGVTEHIATQTHLKFVLKRALQFAKNLFNNGTKFHNY